MLFIPTLFMSLLISADGVSAELVSSNTLPACCAFPGFTPLDEHVTFRGFLRCFLIPKKKKKSREEDGERERKEAKPLQRAPKRPWDFQVSRRLLGVVVGV